MPPFKPTTPDAFGIDLDVYKTPDSPLLDEGKEFFSAPELAQALHIEEKTVRRMIDRHALAFYRISGKILFRRLDVLAYLDPKEDRPTSDPRVPAHAMIRASHPRADWQRDDLKDFEYLAGLLGFVVERSAEDPTVRWVLVEDDARGETLLLVRRIYRDGIGFIEYPSEEAMGRYRANVWAAWNDARLLRF